AQQLNAIESLASVDVVCIDKTGTLTEPRLRVEDFAGVEAFEHLVARHAAAAEARNATLEAIAERFETATDERAEDAVPFSSRRRFGALRFGRMWSILGAPELFELGPYAARVEEETRNGHRVVALGLTPQQPADELPSSVEASGIVVLAERLRPQAKAT